MAVVVSIEKLKRGLVSISTQNAPVVVCLRDSQTVYRDRDTGWVIKGGEEKELPMGPGGTLSPNLLMAVRAGRFVKVGGGKPKKTKVQNLVEYIAEQAGRTDDVEEGLSSESVEATPSRKKKPA